MKNFSNRVGIGRISLVDKRNPYNDKDIHKLLEEAVISAGYKKDTHESIFSEIVKPGDNVLIKPNWVLHKNLSGASTLPLYTNHKLLETLVYEIQKCKPNKIVLGDAPIQGCRFDELVNSEWIEKLQKLSNCPIEIIDFRRTIISGKSHSLSSGVLTDLVNENRYILFNMGDKSHLEDISQKPNSFRVTMYDPRKLWEKHRSGKHEYLLVKEPFEADVIFNVPKLKTHQKSGLTGTLKNLVGINGNKDYLPHHRVGGSKLGGDCYYGYGFDKRIAEFFLDLANMNINTKKYNLYKFISKSILAIRKLMNDADLTGAWYGNDTVWRMTLDLNNLLIYGKLDGTISDKPQRTVYNLTDAVICGHKNGPLEVEEVPLGIITFSTSAVASDFVHAYLMGFDWKKIPLIRESFSDAPLPLTDFRPEEIQIFLNGKEAKLSELNSISKKFTAAPGWIGHIEREI